MKPINLYMQEHQHTRFTQKGTSLLLLTMFLPFLLAMVAFAFDMGKLYVVKAELQNAADACALSAAVELNGTATQFKAAESSGILAGIANKTNMQKSQVSFVNDDGIKFAVNLNDADGSFITATTGSGFSATNASKYKYVKCTANNTVEKLLKIPGLPNNDTIKASAIASLVSAPSACALPIGVCSSAITASTPIGMWFGGQIGTAKPNSINTTICNGTNGPNCSCDGGSCFRWVHFGSGSGSANELQTLLKDKNTCNLDLKSQLVSEQPGSASSPYDEYNTRFGVQKNGDNTNMPDLTGYAYNPVANPSMKNVYSDYITKAKNLTINQQGLPGGYNKIIQPTLLNASPRRVGIAPKLNCSGTSTTVTEWVCVLMLNPISSAGGVANRNLYLEYLGKGDAGACAVAGIAGGSTGGSTVSAIVQ